MKKRSNLKKRVLILGMITTLFLISLSSLPISQAWLLDPGTGAGGGGGGGTSVPNTKHLLLLVHGIYATGSTWNDFIDYLGTNTKYGSNIYAPNLYAPSACDDPTDDPLTKFLECKPIGPGKIVGNFPVLGDVNITFDTDDDTLAKRLHDFLRSKLDDEYQYRIDIVAHSMGGLVVRAMIKYFTDDGLIFRSGTVAYPHRIQSVHFLGTPNRGIDLPMELETIMSGDFQFAMIDSTTTYPWINNIANVNDYIGSIKWYTYRGTNPHDSNILARNLAQVVGMKSDGVVPYHAVELYGNGLAGDFNFFTTHNDLPKNRFIVSMIKNILLENAAITSRTIKYRLTYLHVVNDHDAGAGEIRVIIIGSQLLERTMNSSDSWSGTTAWVTIRAYYYRNNFFYSIHVWEQDWTSPNDFVAGVTSTIDWGSTGTFSRTVSMGDATVTVEFQV